MRPAVQLTLGFKLYWNERPIVVPSEVLTNVAGQRLRLTRLSALVSQMTLQREDGGAVELPGQYGYMDAAAGKLSVILSGVPAGRYRSVAFELGLPPEINHSGPAAWPAAHALNPLVNRLHWGWQGGYIFLALEGRWQDARDIGAAPDLRTSATSGIDAPRGELALPESGFVYHIATDRHRMSCRFLADFSVGGNTTVDLAFDLARVIGKRALVRGGAVESTHSGESDALATEIASATSRAIYWLGAHPTETVPVDEYIAAPAGAISSGATPVGFVVPPGFPVPLLPADNPLTVEGIALGAALFRDVRLSGNARQSCATCHDPERAFADGTARSSGANGEPGRRNTPSLLNLAWHPNYGWDGRQARIRGQALAAMENPREMNGSPGRVIAILQADPELAEKFSAAFGSPGVTEARLGLALEQYILTLVSADSKFDRAARGEAELSAAEREGFALFFREYDPRRGQYGADCFHCHGGPLFSDFALKDNGLGPDPGDRGRSEVTGLATDRGAFKTPSLRNLRSTGPYMHDGRFASLAEVVAHYASGVQRTPNLDPNLAKHPGRGVPLSPGQQAALVAFLEALSP